MEFTYHYEKKETQQVKHFLKEQGISKGLLAKIKFQGGRITVNGQVENVLYSLRQDDTVMVVVPPEGEHETMLVEHEPIDIIFEDRDLLVVNKPAGVATIPAQYHPNGTMANRVKAYYQAQGYEDQVIHVVTRLDRDTSGLMIFAKHGFAHAQMDQLLRKKQLVKMYQALVAGAVEELQTHGEIILPISRDRNSLMRRQVDPAGRYAETEYWLQLAADERALVDIQLHTGRTHQIRVHFNAIGCPLLGDDMYDGRLDLGIQRQALHCCELHFVHPFTGERMDFYQELPADMAAVVRTMTD